MTKSNTTYVLLALIVLTVPSCQSHHEKHEAEHHSIVVTTPLEEDVTVTQQYVCQIHSQRHIEICALQDGYLEKVLVKEGQSVKKGELMFTILPTLYKAKMEAEVAEAKLAQIEFDNTKKLYESKPPVVSIQEVMLAQAKLDKANAKANLAKSEVEFTSVKAPFDGIVDRLNKQLGSLIEKKDILTTLSDNSTMWVYFNMPEARYLEYIERQGSKLTSSQMKLEDSQIELTLANGKKFPFNAGNIVTVEGQFNSETGNIAFRADFPNPDGLLRHGQTGSVLIHRKLRHALVIPQRATFEILDKRFVFTVDEQHVVHQREIAIEQELDDIFVIKSGLEKSEHIVLEGVRQVHHCENVDPFEQRAAEEALARQKHHAE
ncbi:MAG TPA: efflux RND transporter periplasmic adaptor subunit [Gemmatales bacterium]|nr:efflux RND transporter periplasmic adaptor subunit [Gemmatales bacterium]